jgi:hypothetical protein
MTHPVGRDIFHGGGGEHAFSAARAGGALEQRNQGQIVGNVSLNAHDDPPSISNDPSTDTRDAIRALWQHHDTSKKF